MTEKGVRVWVTWNSPSMEGCQGAIRTYKPEYSKLEEYTLLTDQQLAELKQEIWDAARKEDCEGIGFEYEALEDYESKKGGQDG
jgi:hypothetical protein